MPKISNPAGSFFTNIGVLRGVPVKSVAEKFGTCFISPPPPPRVFSANFAAFLSLLASQSPPRRFCPRPGMPRRLLLVRGDVGDVAAAATFLINDQLLNFINYFPSLPPDYYSNCSQQHRCWEEE